MFEVADYADYAGLAKPALYECLAEQAAALLSGERNRVANVWLAACGSGLPGIAVRSATGPAALNGALRLTFDEDLDPLSVTRSSVRVTDAAGRPLESRLEVDGPVMSVLLVVGPELLASPPQRAQVRLAGLPSVHALSTRSGRRLRGTVQAGFELRPGLEGRSGGGSELVAINGRPVSAGVPVTPNGPLVLGFDGVIDPDTVTAAGCPDL